MSKTFKLNINHNGDISLSGHENMGYNTLYVIIISNDADFSGWGLIKSQIQFTTVGVNKLVQRCDPFGTIIDQNFSVIKNNLSLFRSIDIPFVSGIEVVSDPFDDSIDTPWSFMYISGSLLDGKFVCMEQNSFRYKNICICSHVETIMMDHIIPQQNLYNRHSTSNHFSATDCDIPKILKNTQGFQITFQIQSLNDYLHNKIDAIELNRLILAQNINKIALYSAPRQLKYVVLLEFRDKPVSFIPIYVAEWIQYDNKYFIQSDLDIFSSFNDETDTISLRQYDSKLFHDLILLFMQNNAEDIDTIIQDLLNHDPLTLNRMLELTESLDLNIMGGFLGRFIEVINFS
jgi:hypothetical protein